MRPDYLLLLTIAAALRALTLVFDLLVRRDSPPQALQPLTEGHQPRKTTAQVAQEKRLKTLMNNGVFTKIAPLDGVPQAWVGSQFYALDIVTQWEVVSEVYMYYAVQEPGV